MNQQDFDAFYAWRDKVWKAYRDLVPYIRCEDCEGTGEEECSQCGNMTECSTCNGNAEVPLSDVLDEHLYQDCLEWDRRHVAEWVEGEPIHIYQDKRYKNIGGLDDPHPLAWLEEAARKARGEGYESGKGVELFIEGAGG